MPSMRNLQNRGVRTYTTVEPATRLHRRDKFNDNAASAEKDGSTVEPTRAGFTIK